MRVGVPHAFRLALHGSEFRSSRLLLRRRLYRSLGILLRSMRRRLLPFTRRTILSRRCNLVAPFAAERTRRLLVLLAESPREVVLEVRNDVSDAFGTHERRLARRRFFDEERIVALGATRARHPTTLRSPAHCVWPRTHAPMPPSACADAMHARAHAVTSGWSGGMSEACERQRSCRQSLSVACQGPRSGNPRKFLVSPSKWACVTVSCVMPVMCA